MVLVWPSGFAVGDLLMSFVECTASLDGVTSGGSLLVDGVTTCFSTSDAAFGSANARIWGSEDKGIEIPKVLGKKRFKEDKDDFPRLWFVNCFGILGTLGTGKSERRFRDSPVVWEVMTVDVREIGKKSLDNDCAPGEVRRVSLGDIVVAVVISPYSEPGSVLTRSCGRRRTGAGCRILG